MRHALLGTRLLCWTLWCELGASRPKPGTHLRVVGLGQLALPQEELEVPPGHVGQQHHGLFPLLYAHVTDGKEIPGNSRNDGKTCQLVRKTAPPPTPPFVTA